MQDLKRHSWPKLGNWIHRSWRATAGADVQLDVSGGLGWAADGAVEWAAARELDWRVAGGLGIATAGGLDRWSADRLDDRPAGLSEPRPTGWRVWWPAGLTLSRPANLIDRRLVESRRSRWTPMPNNSWLGRDDERRLPSRGGKQTGTNKKRTKQIEVNGSRLLTTFTWTSVI